MRATRARAATVLALAALLIAGGLSETALAQRPGPVKRRSGSYGRQGAEIGVEGPRFVFPIGKGYEDGAHDEEIDINDGVGFGFGLMFLFSDKIAIEGHLLQTGHKTADGREWDLDQATVGFRYIFLHENRLQPFVGAGGARLSLEAASDTDLVNDFFRITGLGFVAYTGVDYVVSSRWVLSARADYFFVSYGDGLFGTAEMELDDPVKGDGLGLTLGLAYRVPVF